MGTFDGMRGWSDIPKSVFSDFHETLRGLTATVPSFYTGAEFSIEYDCFLGGNAKGCDIFFFVYRCPPCTARNGNIGKELLEMDAPAWYADSCGPTFLLNSEAAGLATHQFAMYAAELPNGEAIKIKLNHPVEFMFWAMAGKRALCDQASSEADCELHADCQWLASQDACRPRSCAKKVYFQGPVVPKCGVCVDDEAEFVPEIIIR
ncbi:hypothetical protein DIPPA_11656 [Diplonema papillatum]|nr:hypothetical protein DIPPA_11656 [Diplonema papillatum]